jgi:biopolymer transport protein ExbD
MDAPDLSMDKPGSLVITEKDVDNQMIRVTVKMEGDKPVIRIEDKVADPDPKKLAVELSRYVRSKGHTILLLEVEPKVPHGVTVSIQDAAKGAGMKRVFRLVP